MNREPELEHDIAGRLQARNDLAVIDAKIRDCINNYSAALVRKQALQELLCKAKDECDALSQQWQELENQKKGIK